MGIIQCAKHCKFQLDGYCGLERPSIVTVVDDDCPYFSELFNKSNSLAQANNPNKL